MKRKVVGVEIDGHPIIGYIEDFLPVLEGETQIGQITSAFYSPRLERNIGYALVPIEHAEIGTKLTVGTYAGATTPARVVPKPFIDPKKEIPKT